MAYFAETQDTDSQDTSPFVSVSMTSQTETPDQVQSPQQMQSPLSSLNSPYTLRLQSNRFHDDRTPFTPEEIKKLLERDLYGRLTEVNKSIAEFLFPDTAFGFPVNHQFLKNFYNSFLFGSGELDQANKSDEKSTATFLN